MSPHSLGAPNASASTPSITTPSLNVSQADGQILSTPGLLVSQSDGQISVTSIVASPPGDAHVTYSTTSQADDLPGVLHAPDPSASFV